MDKNNRSLIFWAIGILAAMVLIWGLSKIGHSSGVQNSEILAINDADHIHGNKDAPVKIVVYSDYECPGCSYYEPIVESAREEAGDKVVVVFRYYPLTSIHPYALPAAYAAEAAGIQGKFWEMHELLFARQNSWVKALDKKNTFVNYAKELGLDTAKFSTDMDSAAVKDRVARDMGTGKELKIAATPTIYLDNAPLDLPLATLTASEKKGADAEKLMTSRSIAALVQKINDAAK